jgi:hypothetical protein
MKDFIDVPKFGRDQANGGLEIRAESYDEKDNSIEICWSTGAKVRRYDWRSGSYYDEELVVSPNAVRTERLERGAPFLNSHWTFNLRDILGSVIPGSVQFRAGAAFCRVRLSAADDVQPEIARIKEGTARNVSVGYRIHRVEKTEGDEGDVALWRVVDWEPYEISSVPIPADAGAQVRSADGKPGTRPSEVEMNRCEIIGEAATRSAPSIVNAAGPALARMRMRAAGIIG